MKIDIICSSANHPVNPWLKNWAKSQAGLHEVNLYRDKNELEGGDILFCVSCTQLIDKHIRNLYRETMVLHASDLPAGRGWSPHIWAVLAGNTEITVSLLVAEDKVDSGAIWAKRKIKVLKSDLYDEINAALFDAESALMSDGIEMVKSGKRPRAQPDNEASYYPRRTPKDSQLDPQKSLGELFDQIRVADPQRFPAFFTLHGTTYTVELRKKKPDEEH